MSPLVRRCICMGVTSFQLSALQPFTMRFFFFAFVFHVLFQDGEPLQWREESSGATLHRETTRNGSQEGVRLRNGPVRRSTWGRDPCPSWPEDPTERSAGFWFFGLRPQATEVAH